MVPLISNKAIKVMGLGLATTIAGILAITISGSIISAALSVVRSLPASVAPGQTFDVSIAFTAPADNFNAIGLTDYAPTGWTAVADKSRCSPAPEEGVVSGNKIEYVWFGPYAAGTMFKVVYSVKTPTGTSGTYSFNNTNSLIEYYSGSSGPLRDNIGGQNQLGVSILTSTPVTSPSPSSPTPPSPSATPSLTPPSATPTGIATGNVIFISNSLVKLTGNVVIPADSPQVQVSFEWGETSAYGNATPTRMVSSPGEFTYELSGLKSMTVYHYRIKVVGKVDSYGQDISFTTPVLVVNNPVVTPVPSGSPASTPLASQTTATSAVTRTPSVSSQSINWILVGGIIALILIIGVVVGVIILKR